MILNDKQILLFCDGDTPMMSPIVTEKLGHHLSAKVPSYGINSYGYDIRIRPNTDVRVAVDRITNVLDPIYPDESNFMSLDILIDGADRRFVLLPAHSIALAVAEPHFQMPSFITGIAQSKSTYARNGLITLVTPLEAGWRGDLTLEFSNMAPVPVKLYLDGGVAQIMFFRGDPAINVYAGNYQDQAGLTLGRVK